MSHTGGGGGPLISVDLDCIYCFSESWIGNECKDNENSDEIFIELVILFVCSFWLNIIINMNSKTMAGIKLKCQLKHNFADNFVSKWY